jgi:hypothetical protein
VTRVTVLSVLARTDDEAGGLFLDRPRGREAAGGHHLIESSARLLLTRSLTADWGLGDGASRRQHNNTARVSYISLTDQVGGKRRDVTRNVKVRFALTDDPGPLHVPHTGAPAATGLRDWDRNNATVIPHPALP